MTIKNNERNSPTLDLTEEVLLSSTYFVLHFNRAIWTERKGTKKNISNDV